MNIHAHTHIESNMYSYNWLNTKQNRIFHCKNKSKKNRKTNTSIKQTIYG